MVFIVRIIGTIIGVPVAMIGTIVMVVICIGVVVAIIAMSPFMAISVLFGKSASDYSGMIERPLNWCGGNVKNWWSSLFENLYS